MKSYAADPSVYSHSSAAKFSARTGSWAARWRIYQRSKGMRGPTGTASMSILPRRDSAAAPSRYWICKMGSAASWKS